jgi:hypothetical protein
LDRIGCGQPPRCSPTTLWGLLNAGMIEDTGGQVRRDALGSYRVPFYEMTIPTHMQWCSAVAAIDEEMEAFEFSLEVRS